MSPVQFFQNGDALLTQDCVNALILVYYTINVTFRCPFFMRVTELTFVRITKVHKDPSFLASVWALIPVPDREDYLKRFTQDNTSHVSLNSLLSVFSFADATAKKTQTCICTDKHGLWLLKWPVKYSHTINTWPQKPDGLRRDLRAKNHKATRPKKTTRVGYLDSILMGSEASNSSVWETDRRSESSTCRVALGGSAEHASSGWQHLCTSVIPVICRH